MRRAKVHEGGEHGKSSSVSKLNPAITRRCEKVGDRRFFYGRRRGNGRDLLSASKSPSQCDGHWAWAQARQGQVDRQAVRALLCRTKTRQASDSKGVHAAATSWESRHRRYRDRPVLGLCW